MPLELMQSLFVVWVYVFGALWAVFGLVFVVHFLVPRQLLNLYFKPPYFNQAEVKMLTGFPFAYLRTFVLMRLVAFPASGEKRGLTRVYEVSPRWFRVVSTWLLLTFFIIVGMLFLMMALFLFDLFVLRA